MALVFFQKIVKLLGCNDNHTYIRFYTKKFFCFYRTVYTKIPHSFHTRLLTFCPSSISLIDGLMALVVFAQTLTSPNTMNHLRVRHVYKYFLKSIRTDLRFSYQNSHVKSVGSMNVKLLNRIILVLAHRLHWGYILNPKVLLLHSS